MCLDVPLDREFSFDLVIGLRVDDVNEYLRFGVKSELRYGQALSLLLRKLVLWIPHGELLLLNLSFLL